jgi:prepilin signal peptidase PulO-like enzyme (type II secretory pathway)
MADAAPLLILSKTLGAIVGTSPLGWGIAGLCAVLLAAAAVWDARTGRVPDSVLLAGVCVAFGGWGTVNGMPFALERLGYAALALGLLWGANELYFRWRKQDGFGFGDSKWTAVAIVAYGVRPALAAWFIGSWLALVWVGLRRLTAKTPLPAEPAANAASSSPAAAHPAPAGGVMVRFVPFLMLGLLIAIALQGK